MRKIVITTLVLSLCSIALAANNYLMTTVVISPNSVSAPAKGGSHTDTTTGATWTRRSDTSEMGTTTDAMVVYSRFSPSNSNGQYLLVHGVNSTSCYVYRLSDNTMVADLKRDGSHQIGENNEIRWDYTGNFPNRVYFINGMSFYYMDVIAGNGNPTLIRDFSSDFTGNDNIMNDVEGDSSSDSRYWAWQVLGPYDGLRFPRKNIFTYDKQTNSILGILNIGDVTPAQNASAWTTRLPTPNMVEISPDGNYVITHYSRSYAGSETGDFYNTYFDGAFAWNLDFSGTPVQISVADTHSGWGYLADGTLVFVSQQDRTDKLQYCRPDGVGGDWPNNCADFFDHAAGDYFGHHYAKMPASKPGWMLIGTAALDSDKYPENQLLMVELKPSDQNPRTWRISPMYNQYAGNYRQEASAAISQDGNKIYVTNNWMNAATGHGEAYEIDITGWGEQFGIAEEPGITNNHATFKSGNTHATHKTGNAAARIQ